MHPSFLSALRELAAVTRDRIPGSTTFLPYPSVESGRKPTTMEEVIAAHREFGGTVVGVNSMRHDTEGNVVTGRAVGWAPKEVCEQLRAQRPKQRFGLPFPLDTSWMGRVERLYAPPHLSPFSNHLKRGLGFELQLRYLIAARLTEGRIVR